MASKVYDAFLEKMLERIAKMNWGRFEPDGFDALYEEPHAEK